MRHQIIIRESKSSDQYLAYCPELVGCSAAGTTEEEAVSSLLKRMQVRLKSFVTTRASLDVQAGQQ
jgi:predicted RNase H-like HicB family nuclease